VRFTTGTEVQDIGYAIRNNANVLSMSMGGLPSNALADAVNLGYEKGLVMVTAAGNNYATRVGPLPYRKIVWPARYQRVIAACGLMADYEAYFGRKPRTMQGNFGPPSKMETAIGAYTPNTPWAKIDCPGVVDMDGAGTSSSTPSSQRRQLFGLLSTGTMSARFLNHGCALKPFVMPFFPAR
jgi:subtilisin family serine protease